VGQAVSEAPAEGLTRVRVQGISALDEGGVSTVARLYAPRVNESDEPSGPVHTVHRDRFAFLLILGGTFGLQAMIMVSGIITARLLGVQGRGQIALVFALSLAAAQLTFGGSLPNAIAKGLAERRVAARDGLRLIARRRAAWILVPGIAAGGVAIALQHNHGDALAFGLGVAAFVMTVQTIATRLLIGSLQGEVGHLGRMAVVGLIPQFLITVVLMVVLVLGWSWGVAEVLTAYFVTTALGLAIGFLALARPTGRPEDALDEGALIRTTRDAYVSSVRPVDSVGIDRILVGSLLGTAALGLYSAATAVSSLCRIVGSAVSVIVLPRVAMHQDDPASDRAIVRRWLLLSGILISFMALGVEAVTGAAIQLAFGADFAPAIPAARWLVLADALFGFRSVLIAVLQGRGRSSTASWIELAITPVMIVSLVLASSADHMTAIGMAMAAVGVLSCVGLGVAVRRSEPRTTGPTTGAVARPTPVAEAGASIFEDGAR
jgi:O-antigen/teichoic acid export membrane protein